MTNNVGGTVKTSAALFSFTSIFTNNGSYQSTDGSTQTFTTMVVGSLGDVRAGAGEVFNIGRNFTNNSSRTTTFNLGAAQVSLTGSGINHRVAWPGADRGPTWSGYERNFVIGTLEVTTGGALTLVDGDNTAGGALYVRRLLLNDGVSQVGSIATTADFNIYYDAYEPDNAYLGGQTYQLNGGGVLVPVTAPSIDLSSLADGALQIEFIGILQSSSDLKGWQDLEPQPNSPYTIPREALTGMLFFRARASTGSSADSVR